MGGGTEPAWHAWHACTTYSTPPACIHFCFSCTWWCATSLTCAVYGALPGLIDYSNIRGDVMISTMKHMSAKYAVVVGVAAHQVSRVGRWAFWYWPAWWSHLKVASMFAITCNCRSCCFLYAFVDLFACKTIACIRSTMQCQKCSTIWLYYISEVYDEVNEWFSMVECCERYEVLSELNSGWVVIWLHSNDTSSVTIPLRSRPTCWKERMWYSFFGAGSSGKPSSESIAGLSTRTTIRVFHHDLGAKTKSWNHGRRKVRQKR